MNLITKNTFPELLQCHLFLSILLPKPSNAIGSYTNQTQLVRFGNYVGRGQILLNTCSMKMGRVPGKNSVTASHDSYPIFRVIEMSSLSTCESSWNRPYNCKFVRLVHFVMNIPRQLNEWSNQNRTRIYLE